MSILKAHCYMKFEYYVDGQSLTMVDSMIDIGITLTTSMTSKITVIENKITVQISRFGNIWFQI